MSIYKWTQEWAKEQGQICETHHEIESTQKTALKEAQQVTSSEKLYLAEIQTQGRGRGDNLWATPLKNGSSLLSTWSYKIKSCPQHLTSIRVGLALYRSVYQIWPDLNWSLKPPNDLFLNQKKVAGLLINTVNNTRLVIGLGFNVFDHPQEVKTSTHLSNLIDVDQNTWKFFLSNLSYNFYHTLSHLDETTLHESEILKLNFAIEKHIDFKNFLCIKENGDLLFKDQTHIPWQDL